MKIAKDTPLMELTLRRYEKPINLDNRELVRKFCLSIGLLQPGDSRDIIVDILYVLLDARTNKAELSSERIRDTVIKLRQEKGLPVYGVASSNIRRQVKRLRDLLIVEKIKNNYRITEFSKLDQAFNEKLVQYLLPSVLTRIKDYYSAIDEKFV